MRMSDRDLFGQRPDDVPPSKPLARSGAARVVRVNRHQATMRAEVLDEILPDAHRARDLWLLVERLDLSSFYERIEARGSSPGQPAIDPKILVALWVYATAEGVGSARALERLSREHDAYRWLCGGVSVNHHTLSDFRVGRGKELDELMTQLLGLLMSSGVVTLRRVAQDGTRVRASAGAASFRRERSLKKCLREARKRVKALKEQCETEDRVPSEARRRAARERAARERQERIERALEKLPEAREAKPSAKKDQARVSTTDADARPMKMADGGFRPAFNVQLAVDTESRVVVGVDVVNKGSDAAQMPPMLEQIEERTGQLPKEILVDGGFGNQQAIEKTEARGVKVYAPPMKPRTDRDPYEPLPNDSSEIAGWRRRMGTPEAKAVYKERAATIETIKGDLRTHRGLDHFSVRGLDKALSVALWASLTFNMLRWIALEGM